MQCSQYRVFYRRHIRFRFISIFSAFSRLCVCAMIFNMSQLSAELAAICPSLNPPCPLTHVAHVAVLGLASEQLETNAELMPRHVRRHRRCRQ